MKKLYFSAAFLFLTGSLFSQVFWTEDFGTGCNRGQLATSYAGSNGAWTIATTGANGNVANTWYVSATAHNTGANNCVDNCIFSSVSNASLHVSNVSIVIPSFLTVNPDSGCGYFTGGLSSFGYVATTNARVESPVINCTGQSNIAISFIYIENGQGAMDDATLVYSPDGGVTWTAIDPLAKTTGCVAGQWTNYTVSLPATADNNAMVKIGFAWTNNDDGQGTDPSFAVDDIALNSTTGMTAGNMSVNLTVINNDVKVETTHSWNLVSVTNMMGQPVQAVRNENMINVGDHAEGVYFVTLMVNGEQVVRKIFLQ